MIHSRGRNSLGLLHKLRERRKEGPQVAFWRYGWDVNVPSSDGRLRSVYRTGADETDHYTVHALIFFS